MKDDTISRAAALDALDRLEYTPGEWVTNGLTMCKDVIKALPSAQPDVPGINVIIDTIKNAINASTGNDAYMVGLRNGMRWCLSALTDKEPEYEDMPSAQPNLSEAYSKAVFTWLMDYQIRTAELKGRYTPYEVLSWVINDWRKEHEQFD